MSLTNRLLSDSIHKSGFQVNHSLIEMLNYLKTAIFLIPCFFTLSILISCKSDPEPDSRVVKHPIPELIPFQDRPHIPIDDKNSFQQMAQPDSGLIMLHLYLGDSSNFIQRQFDIILEEALDTKIESITSNRVSVLDTENDQLYEVDLQSEETQLIANFGRGPGEIQHSIDLEFFNNQIYVARRDMRISRFNCANIPCSYESTLNIEQQPISIAFIPNNIAIAPGFMYLGNQELESNNVIDFPSIQLMGLDSLKIEKTLGNIYRTRYLRVLGHFSRTALLESIPQSENFIWANRWFPYIYVYNTSGLLNTFQLTNFHQNTFEFFPNSHRNRFTFDSKYTRIIEIDRLNENQILIVSKTEAKSSETSEGNEIFDFQFNYYVVDLLNKEAYKVGTDMYSGLYERLLFVKNNHLFKIEKGRLYLLERF